MEGAVILFSELVGNGCRFRRLRRKKQDYEKKEELLKEAKEAE